MASPRARSTGPCPHCLSPDTIALGARGLCRSCRKRWELAKPKKHKYRANPLRTREGYFASTWEHTRWQQLRWQQRAGLIRFLYRQVRLPLEHGGSCIVDALYERVADGELVLEDAKSKPTTTALFRLKKKQILSQYGLEIQEVRRG